MDNRRVWFQSRSDYQMLPPCDSYRGSEPSIYSGTDTTDSTAKQTFSGVGKHRTSTFDSDWEQELALTLVN